MRWVTFGCVLALILLPGCSSIKQKLGFGGSTQQIQSRTPPPHETKPPKAEITPTSGNNVNGVLAGQVVDAFNQRRPHAILQVQATDKRDDDEPLDANANGDGYFMIQGLQPGRRYKVVAWAEKGDQPLGGTTITTAPNVALVIKVSEQFATPVPPTSKLEPRGRLPENEPKSQPGPKYLHERDGQEKGNEAENAPVVRPDMQTKETRLTQNDPPRVELPPAPSSRSPALGAPLPPKGTASECVLDGGRLQEFVVKDLTGKPFRFSDQRARLTLIDFWGTWCPACIQAMPELAELDRRYGTSGLAILGIAYEEGSLKEQADRVTFVARRQGASYRMLLGDADGCPLIDKLGVQTYPTLLLVNERGDVLWRGEGMTASNKARLEAEIRRQLGK